MNNISCPIISIFAFPISQFTLFIIIVIIIVSSTEKFFAQPKKKRKSPGILLIFIIFWLHSVVCLDCNIYNLTGLHLFCPGYDTERFDGEIPVMLECWGVWSAPLLPSLPGLLWPGVVALGGALSVSLMELNCVPVLGQVAWSGTVLTCELWTLK